MTGTRAPLVIGIDYGTLSGRAVVVRTDDGAELGAATYDYPHGVIDRVLPETGAAAAAGLGVAGTRTITSAVLRHAVPEAIRDAGVDPADVVGVGNGFHRLHDAAGHRRRHPAVHPAGIRRPSPRLRQALEAPFRAAPGRPDQRLGRGPG